MLDLNNEKFLLLRSIKLISIKCDTYLENIPKSDYDYKLRIRSSIENMYKLLIQMNYIENEIEFEKLNAKLKAEISYFDFSLGIIYDKKYINQKNLSNLMYNVNEFNKMLFKWHSNKMENKNEG